MKRLLVIALTITLLVGMLLVPATSSAASTGVVHGGWLRLRAQPNFSAHTVSSYYTGTVVTILDTLSSWYHVQAPDGRTGYMYSAYVSAGGGGGGGTGNATVWSSNGYGVRMRSGPGKGYKTLAVYSVGTSVNVLERGGIWSRIQVGGRVGYMMNEFLTGGGTPGPIPTYGPLSNASIWSANGLGVRLRSGPSKGYSTIGVYSVGTPVTVLQKGPAGGWDYIQVGSRTGYMMNEFLHYYNPTPTATPTATVTPTPAPGSLSLTGVSLSLDTPVLGKDITATVLPAGATATYQWFVDGVLQSNAKDAKFTVPAGATAGQFVSVIAVGTGTYSGSAAVTSKYGILTNSALVDSVLNFAPSQQPVVGDTVKVIDVMPEGAKYTYKWYTDDNGLRALVGTSPEYTVQPGDKDKEIVFIAEGVAPYTGLALESRTGTVLDKWTTNITVTLWDDALQSGVGTSANAGQKIRLDLWPEQAKVNCVWMHEYTINSTAQPAAQIGSGNTLTIPAPPTTAGYGLTKIYAKVTPMAGTPYASATVTQAMDITTVTTKSTLNRVVVGGDMLVDSKLTVKAYGPDANTVVADANVTFDWYRVEDGHCVGTGKEYTLQGADRGKTIMVKANGTGTFTGLLTYTAPKKVLEELDSVTFTQPSPLVVGSKLTAAVAPAYANVQYAWFRGLDTGSLQNMNNATEEYTITSADLQSPYIFVVRAVGIGDFTGKVNSKGVADSALPQGLGLMVAPLTMTIPLPTDSDPTVALTLTSDESLGYIANTAVSNAPEGERTYEWVLDGTKITDWTKSYYPVSEGDYGKELTVKVFLGDSQDTLETTLTLVAPGEAVRETETPEASETPAPSEGAPQENAPAIALSLSSDEAGVQTAHATVSNLPEGASPSYAWYVGGQMVTSGSDTYTVQAADYGSNLEVYATFGSEPFLTASVFLPAPTGTGESGGQGESGTPPQSEGGTAGTPPQSDGGTSGTPPQGDTGTPPQSEGGIPGAEGGIIPQGNGGIIPQGDIGTPSQSEGGTPGVVDGGIIPQGDIGTPPQSNGGDTSFGEGQGASGTEVILPSVSISIKNNKDGTGQTAVAVVSDVSAQSTLRYEWYLAKALVSNEIDSTYAIQPEDYGKSLRVRVYVDGSTESITYGIKELKAP